jgi:hypothetical protein
MTLTGHELLLIPSIVALAAIGGTIYGARTSSKSTLKAVDESNKNALSLAREERQARRTYELTELKRDAYARCLEVMYELEIASVLTVINARASSTGIVSVEILERRTKAFSEALNSSAQIKLFGPPIVVALVNELMVLASKAAPESYVVPPDGTKASAFNIAQARLIGAMVASLEGKEVTPEVLANAVRVASTGPRE